jgi:hypothetical protein
MPTVQQVFKGDLNPDHFDFGTIVASKISYKGGSQSLVKGVGFPTTPPPDPKTDWEYLDTSKNTITATWDSVAADWLQVGTGVWDKDLNTGITAEEGANDNAIRAYISGVASGVMTSTLTGWGYEANSQNTGANASGFGAYANQGNTGSSASGFGYSANYLNSGANASGFGSNANSQNTGANASGFGVSANYLNSGADASGFGLNANSQNTGANASGFGAYANQGNTGSSASGFGYSANYLNSGANASGFGSNANSQNTGANASGFGVSANYLNSGADASGFGLNANSQNTGANASGFGAYANQGNTGSSASGFGYSANYLNSGANASGFGLNANSQNTGANASGFGVSANYLNSGADNSSFGHNAQQYQRGSRNTALGANTFGARESFSTTVAQVNVAANTITIPAHTFGAAGAKFAVEFPVGSTPPAPFAAGEGYLFEVVDANTIEPVFNTITAAPPGPFTANTALPLNNCSAVGEGASPDKDNQVLLGGPGTTDLKTIATNIVFGALPTFATDALADAALVSGQLYKLSSGRAVFQRP